MKLKLAIGGFEVNYAGSEEFAEQKLQDVLKELVELAVSEGRAQIEVADGNKIGNPVNQLSDFLRRLERSGLEQTQTDKHLATSAWLHLTGMERIKSGNVADALQDYNETALANPSDCLAKNIKRKLCERDGRNGPYFVTAQGFRHLGLDVKRSDDGTWELRGDDE